MDQIKPLDIYVFYVMLNVNAFQVKTVNTYCISYNTAETFIYFLKLH